MDPEVTIVRSSTDNCVTSSQIKIKCFFNLYKRLYKSNEAQIGQKLRTNKRNKLKLNLKVKMFLVEILQNLVLYVRKAIKTKTVLSFIILSTLDPNNSIHVLKLHVIGVIILLTICNTRENSTEDKRLEHTWTNISFEESNKLPKRYKFQDKPEQNTKWK